MDVEIEQLLTLSLEDQNKTLKAYGFIREDIHSHEGVNLRLTQVFYRGDNFLISMRNGEVLRVSHFSTPKPDLKNRFP